MWRPEPRLQRKLLAWLLGPLAVLLVLDSAAAYWQSLRLSNLAYDRALYEVAREIVLHVKLDGDKPRLEMSEAAANVLLLDQEDQLFYRVVSEGGLLLGGNADMPAPKVDKAAKPYFHVGEVRGQPVRMMVAWMPLGADAGPPLVLVQVAETLNKRSQFTWEMVASVVLPQMLLKMERMGCSRPVCPPQRSTSA